jgi:hypothetical protein
MTEALAFQAIRKQSIPAVENTCPFCYSDVDEISEHLWGDDGCLDDDHQEVSGRAE